MVTPAVILDAGPLGVLCNPRSTPTTAACRGWLAALLNAGRRVILPEIADYEVRREFLRRESWTAVARLEELIARLEFAPLSTPAMHRAAALWAAARNAGTPTAAADRLDADTILLSQAELVAPRPYVIATSNVAHLGTFAHAAEWHSIPA